MKKFSDLGIDVFKNNQMFEVPAVSITDILNCEIEVLGYESGVDTKMGPDRCIVHIRHEGKECKFFTSAKPIKNALEQVSKDKFPFTTVIKQHKYGSGNNKTFLFT